MDEVALASLNRPAGQAGARELVGAAVEWFAGTHVGRTPDDDVLTAVLDRVVGEALLSAVAPEFPTTLNNVERRTLATAHLGRLARQSAAIGSIVAELLECVVLALGLCAVAEAGDEVLTHQAEADEIRRLATVLLEHRAATTSR